MPSRRRHRANRHADFRYLVIQRHSPVGTGLPRRLNKHLTGGDLLSRTDVKGNDLTLLARRELRPTPNSHDPDSAGVARQGRWSPGTPGRHLPQLAPQPRGSSFRLRRIGWPRGTDGRPSGFIALQRTGADSPRERSLRTKKESAEQSPKTALALSKTRFHLENEPNRTRQYTPGHAPTSIRQGAGAHAPVIYGSASRFRPP